MSRRTGGLTAVCVIALVVGILSVLSGLFQFTNLLFADKLQAAVAGIQPGAEAQQLQQEMSQQTAAISRKYAVYHWLSASTQSVLAWIMIVGAVMTLRLKPAGRKLLLAALIASLLFEPAKAVLTAAVTRETAPIILASMQQAAKASAPPGAKPPEGIDPMISGISQLVVVMQWVMLIGMTALWCVFYLIGAWYLTRPAVKALFVVDVPSESARPGESAAPGDPELR